MAKAKAKTKKLKEDKKLDVEKDERPDDGIKLSDPGDLLVARYAMDLAIAHQATLISAACFPDAMRALLDEDQSYSQESLEQILHRLKTTTVGDHTMYQILSKRVL